MLCVILRPPHQKLVPLKRGYVIFELFPKTCDGENLSLLLNSFGNWEMQRGWSKRKLIKNAGEHQQTLFSMQAPSRFPPVSHLLWCALPSITTEESLKQSVWFFGADYSVITRRDREDQLKFWFTCDFICFPLKKFSKISAQKQLLYWFIVVFSSLFHFLK